MSHNLNSSEKVDHPVFNDQDNLFSILIQSFPAMIVVIDTTRRIVNASNTFITEMGYPNSDIIGITIDILLGEKNRGTFINYFSEITGISEFALDLKKQNQSGELVSFNAKISNMTIAGKRLFLLFIDKKENFNNNEKIEKLEHQAAIGTFTSGIAHEFNNILAGIRGYTQLAQHDTNDRALVSKAFAIIESETSRGAELCKNLSLYAGNKRLVLGPVDMAQSILQVVDSQKEYCSKNNIIIDTDFEDTPAVIADKNRIFQMLANLLTNARHAVIPKGHGNIRVSLSSDNDSVIIRVSDDGIGISPQQIEHVFEPFFNNILTTRSVNNKNYEIRGTGLGLSVCQVIAKQHGGVIHVQSSPESGTVFTVSLPKKYAQVFPESYDAVWKNGKRSRMIKVLVVDDEMSIREILYRTLCTLDVETYLAGNISELQDLIMENSFDLIFLDYVLPEMNADKIIPVLKDKFPASRIVIISGWNGSPLKRSQIEKTVDAWIEKPFNVEAIIEQLSIYRKNSNI